MNRVGIFLIAIALVAGMAGCDEVTPPTRYNLSMAVAPVDSGSVTDLTDGSPYTADTKVNIKAVAAEGYSFVYWTAPVGTFGNQTATTTTFNMPAQNVTVTANFVAVYDLTISSTAGGSVTTPSEGTFTYDEGTVVNLVAEADSGYQFANWTGNVSTVCNVTAAITNITMNGNYSITANFQYTPMVAAGAAHTMGLRSDGTVVAVGLNDEGQCNIGGWGNITQVSAGGWHTVGLKDDGTVVAVGYNSYGQCDVSGWTGIVQVAGGGWHTVGVKSNGTVVAVGRNDEGQCNIGGWGNITQVAPGRYHTVGLKDDGTVVAVGNNDYGRCDVGGWTDITQVACGYAHTVGLKSNGTVVAVGRNDEGQCEVGNWTNVTQVAARWFHTVGLTSAGTVVAVGRNWDGQCNVGNWTDIIQVSAGAEYTVGLKDDGTVVAVGRNDYGQCDVGGWDLN